MIHTWLQPTWQRLIELGERLPHALLFVGPAGLGKRELAEALAARLLCDTPRADGHACSPGILNEVPRLEKFCCAEERATEVPMA